MRQQIRRFWSYSLLEKAESLEEFYWLCKTRFYYRLWFGGIGPRSKVLKPMRLKEVENIYIGDNVLVNKSAFLLTCTLPGGPTPRLVIEDGCVIGHINHITCVESVTICANVLTADRVHISDNGHIFTDPHIPIVRQGVASCGRVVIGEGSWIGENVSVLSCSVGRHCVIGANSVVIHDVPDHCVAVGAPARVVRQLDLATGEWKPVDRSSERRFCLP